MQMLGNRRPVTVAEITRVHDEAMQLTVKNIYSVIAQKRGVERMSTRSANAFMHDTIIAIVLVANKLNLRITVPATEIPDRRMEKIIIDLHFRHNMGVEPITKFLNFSNTTVIRVLNQEKLKRGPGSAEAKEEIETDPFELGMRRRGIINDKGDFDAFEFVRYLSGEKRAGEE